MLKQYINKRLSAKKGWLIDRANQIIEQYQAAGYDLTLRQLYYQFVQKNLIPNTVKSYNMLGLAINDGRMCGWIDWEAIVDRSRVFKDLPHWLGPGEIVKACSEQFNLDKWDDQKFRLEVWVEKEALVGIVQKACEPFDVPYFACKGYPSQSEVWAASQRLIRHMDNDQRPIIIHLGDHDPSGIDMTRDIEERLGIFLEDDAYITTQAGAYPFEDCKRIALNIDQVERFHPPPNPAKVTDTRFKAYARKFGTESWELDALPPEYLLQIIQDAIHGFLDVDKWNKKVKREKKIRKSLATVGDTLTAASKIVRN